MINLFGCMGEVVDQVEELGFGVAFLDDEGRLTQGAEEFVLFWEIRSSD